jgi:hypothetical protein
VGEPVVISRERDSSGVLRLSGGDRRVPIARLRPAALLMVSTNRRGGGISATATATSRFAAAIPAIAPDVGLAAVAPS